MRNIKTLLRLMGAVALTTVAASSVVACGTNAKELVLNGKYATLLDWYGADNKTSKIEQQLNKNEITTGKEKYEVIADNTKITATNFKTTLLKQEEGKWIAKSDEAAAFLADLGFKKGSKTKEYGDEVTAIEALKAKVTSSEAGKIEAITGNTDFKVADGTCQVSIMDKATDGKAIRNYTITTLKKDSLAIPTAVVTLVVTENLDLTSRKGYKKDGNVLTSLPWISGKEKEERLYNSLVELIGGAKLEWYAVSIDGTTITKYPNDRVKTYLMVKSGDVNLLAQRLECPVLSV